MLVWYVSMRNFLSNELREQIGKVRSNTIMYDTNTKTFSAAEILFWCIYHLYLLLKTFRNNLLVNLSK